jgi:hypothetical protein
MEFVLVRRYLKSGTNGTLLFNGKEICKTIELPWMANQRRISCIPEGTYRLRKRFSPKYQWHLEVVNVIKRDLILIHPANDALKELNGCIAPVAELTGEGKGIQSRIACERLTSTIFPFLEKGFSTKLTIKTMTL